MVVGMTPEENVSYITSSQVPSVPHSIYFATDSDCLLLGHSCNGCASRKRLEACTTTTHEVWHAHWEGMGENFVSHIIRCLRLPPPRFAWWTVRPCSHTWRGICVSKTGTTHRNIFHMQNHTHWIGARGVRVTQQTSETLVCLSTIALILVVNSDEQRTV